MNNYGVSDSLIVGFDLSKTGDKAVLSVARFNGRQMTMLNTFVGEEAVLEYEKLTGQKVQICFTTETQE